LLFSEIHVSSRVLYKGAMEGQGSTVIDCTDVTVINRISCQSLRKTFGAFVPLSSYLSAMSSTPIAVIVVPSDILLVEAVAAGPPGVWKNVWYRIVSM